MGPKIYTREEALALLDAFQRGGRGFAHAEAGARLRDAAPDLAYTVDHQAATIADQEREITSLRAERDAASERAVTLEHQHAHAVETMERMGAQVTRAEAERDAALAQAEQITRGLREAQERARQGEALAKIHREERDACAAEVVRLRAIIEGRTTPPTEAEIAAHEAAGGRWRSVVPGEWILSTDDGDAEDARKTIGVQSANAAIVATCGVTWWAHDADHRPCAWPVAPEAPR